MQSHRVLAAALRHMSKKVATQPRVAMWQHQQLRTACVSAVVLDDGTSKLPVMPSVQAPPHESQPGESRFGIVQVLRARVVPVGEDPEAGVDIVPDSQIDAMLTSSDFLAAAARKPRRLYMSRSAAQSVLGHSQLTEPSSQVAQLEGASTAATTTDSALAPTSTATATTGGMSASSIELAQVLAKHASVTVAELTGRGSGEARRALASATAPVLPGRGTSHEGMTGTVKQEGRAQPSAVATLAQHGAQSEWVPGPPAATNDEKELLLAAGAADIVTVRELVQGRGVSVHVTHAQHGGTPLHMLCAWPEPDDEDAVAAALVLLQAGAHPRALAGNGSTPLHWAAGSGNTGLIKVLLEHGADPAATTYTWRRQVFGKGSGQTAAHWAAESNHVEALQMLSDASISSAVVADERGSTPRDVAEKEGATAAKDLLAKVEATELLCVEVALEWEGQGRL